MQWMVAAQTKVFYGPTWKVMKLTLLLRYFN